MYPTRPRCTLPDFASFDAAISTGKINISAAWREYAATAPRPFSQFTFIWLYRQWQAFAAIDATTEFKASEAYWHGRAAPRPAIIVLDNGASVRMKGGLLEVHTHGEPRKVEVGRAESQTLRFDPSPLHRKPRAIVFANWGGLFTIPAARFCVEHNIAVVAAGWLGERMTFVSGSPRQDAALVRAQCRAPADAARLKLSHNPGKLDTLRDKKSLEEPADRRAQ